MTATSFGAVPFSCSSLTPVPSFLSPQEKAAKLDSCWCDGREDYDCPAIRANMARLCFHQEPPRPPPEALPGDVDTNELLPKRDGGGAAALRPLVALVAAAVLAAASCPS